MPTPIVDDIDRGVDEYVEGFLPEFSGSRMEYRGVYDGSDSVPRKALVAVMELFREGRRVVGRGEITKKIVECYGVDELPKNFDARAKRALVDYGLVIEIDRFENLGHNWYYLDEQFLKWAHGVDRRPGEPPTPEEPVRTMAGYLARGTIDGESVSPLIAWFAGQCAEYASFTGYDASIEMLDPTRDSIPKEYLLTEYLRQGNYADDFKQYLVHAEFDGKFDFESRPLFEEAITHRFETLQAATAYQKNDDFAVPNFQDLRWKVTNQEAGKRPEEWHDQLGSDAVCFSLDTRVTENRIVVSCYRGKWDK